MQVAKLIKVDWPIVVITVRILTQQSFITRGVGSNFGLVQQGIWIYVYCQKAVKLCHSVRSMPILGSLGVSSEIESESIFNDL